MTYLILKNEFSQIRVCFSIRALRRTSALNNDFSRRHLCQNPPALAGGRLRWRFTINKEAYTYVPAFVLQFNLVRCLALELDAIHKVASWSSVASFTDMRYLPTAPQERIRFFSLRAASS